MKRYYFVIISSRLPRFITSMWIAYENVVRIMPWIKCLMVSGWVFVSVCCFFILATPANTNIAA